MKLLIFSDSLSLPREIPEVCKYNETWPERLRMSGHEVCISAIGGATINDLLKQTFYFKNSANFNAIIVQSGIVDCAPRFVKKWELKVLQSIPYLGSKILSLLNSNTVRRVRKITYTKVSTFEKALVRFELSFSCPVFFIEIAPATKEYERQLPGVKKNIDCYNQLIQQHKHISLHNLPQEGLMTDGHHLNPLGHLFIAQQVLNCLNGTIN
jgi:hypothetical protein